MPVATAMFGSFRETDTEICCSMRWLDSFRLDTLQRAVVQGVSGVVVVAGKLKPDYTEGHDPEELVIESIRFVRQTADVPDGWTQEKAAAWVEAHPYPIQEMTQAAQMARAARLREPLHTTLQIDGALAAEADRVFQEGQDGDPRFNYTLCRVGGNKNGDFFSADELRSRYPTVVNKKIDLQHSPALTDVVGATVSAEFVDDPSGGRIDCVGELWVREALQAPLAYRSMKSGIIAQVSMECDYETGECSICGKKFTAQADYCLHLKKYKGGEYQGKPVYEILHGVTFTGTGLLDRKGADENARITNVASVSEADIQWEDFTMTDDEKRAAEAAAKKSADEAAAAAAKKAADEDAAAKSAAHDLEAENKKLAAKVAELQQRIQELEAEQKAAAQAAKAAKLVQSLVQQGMTFASDEERDAEIGRLSGLSDEAFSATEAAYKLALPKAAASKAGDDEAAKAAAEQARQEEAKKAEAAAAAAAMRATAGAKPLAIDDKAGGVDLKEQYESLLMAEYKARVGGEKE